MFLKSWNHCWFRLASSPVTSLHKQKIDPRRWKSFQSRTEPTVLQPKRALILTKLSRYEFERLRHADLNEKQLQEALRKRGSDYNHLLYHHTIHKNCEAAVIKALKEHNIETKVVNRFNYNEKNIEWADMIVATGGDGTYLLGASKLLDPTKPIIGFNSDPTRSEGYLCFPKKYSSNVQEAITKMYQGKFRWLFRKRIRITLIGEEIFEPPVELHDQQLQHPEYRFEDCLQERQRQAARSRLADDATKNCRVLPVRALNEVFIGEALSARVSYYELAIDDGERSKVKSSGLCICTGTGSTSWTFNINKLKHQAVGDLLKLLKEESNLPVDYRDQSLIDRITRKFNSDLIFGPAISLMGYTIRDPVSDGTLPLPGERRSRGYAERMEIRSRCFDASLVIDGGLSFRFNDGTRAIMSIHDEDALRTIILHEQT